MNSIAQLYGQLPDVGFPTRHSSEFIKFSQEDVFFHLAVAKDVRARRLKSRFLGQEIKKVFLSANLSGFDCTIDGVDVSTMEKNFFFESDPDLRLVKFAQLDQCVVIVNNNDVGSPDARSAYLTFFLNCVNTCFIAWDWDNHHWLELSTFLAAHSDIYAPAHHENLYLLSRYNHMIAGPVYCSSVQWSRKFLTENLTKVLSSDRSDYPLGMHIPYAQFNYRIQVISTVNKFYPSVGFSGRSFHDRTPLDKLEEWCAHKTHWISPVLNDVPIRLFDALLTGGIPMVPDSMRFLPPVADIPRKWIAFYSASDIVSPTSLVEYANKLFDDGGQDEIVARHRYALDHHHGNSSILKMLSFAREVLTRK
jgi:hypothetical protein